MRRKTTNVRYDTDPLTQVMYALMVIMVLTAVVGIVWSLLVKYGCC